MMFTLKFRHKEGWDVYETDRYQIHNYDHAKHVHFTPGDDDQAISAVISEEEYNACFVVNNNGETVDRIYMPSVRVEA